MMMKTTKINEKFLPFWIVILGFALRIFAAISHLDVSHPDEHFQNLEPASRVVFGFGWLSWEWSDGIRSWFVPGLYMPTLWIFKALGVRGGPLPIAACRVLMATVTSACLFSFWKLVKDSGLKRGAGLMSLAAFALLPACAAWGAMTLSDVWAMSFLGLALPFVVGAIETRKRVFLAGILLGLSFLARIQMAIWPVGIVCVLLVRHWCEDESTVNPGVSPWTTLARFSAGYCVVLVFQGLLDWATWGSPFHSVIANIEKNVFEHAASFYGTSPGYEYLVSLPRQMGWIFFTVLTCVFFYAWVLRKKRFRQRDLLILFPALLYLGVHSAIPHKEIRFMLPVLPSLFYFLAWSLDSIELKRRLSDLIFIGGAAFVAMLNASRVYSTDYIYPYDLSKLTQKIREDGGLREGDCILFIDHYWVWTRGELMLGQRTKFVEARADFPLPEEGARCRYAIASAGREGRPWMKSGKWHKIDQDAHGQILLKQDVGMGADRGSVVTQGDIS